MQTRQYETQCVSAVVGFIAAIQTDSADGAGSWWWVVGGGDGDGSGLPPSM